MQIFYFREITIIFGEHDRTKKSKKNFEETDFGGISRAKMHEAYKPHPYFLNDIAVIELKRDVKKTGILLVALQFPFFWFSYLIK